VDFRHNAGFYNSVSEGKSQNSQVDYHSNQNEHTQVLDPSLLNGVEYFKLYPELLLDWNTYC